MIGVIVLAIHFCCENLEEAIRRAEGFTGAESGPIYPEDVLRIKKLNAKHFGITSLEGFQYLVNLQALDLESNKVRDLTPLENLFNLQELNFNDNQVSALAPLKNLFNLQHLWFKGNRVSDLTPLQNLINLQTLNFEGNQVSALAPLQNLINLQGLYFDGNQVSDLAPLQNLVNLQGLGFEGNQVSDLALLKNLFNLQHLWFKGNRVSDLTPLQNLINLQTLNFESNQVSDLAPLQNLVNLRKLYFDNNQVSDLAPLRNLVNLRKLYFDNNQVSDLALLKNLFNLQHLWFKGNRVSDLTPLRNLVNLQQLWLDGNQISDLTPLRNLVNLLIHGFQNMNDINTLVGRGVMVMESGNGAEKDYLSISELSKKTELPTATIRRWVTTYKDIFGRFIKPIGEFIYYEPNIVEWLKKVQELYDAGMKESLIDEWYTFVTEENNLSNSLSISELSKVTGIPAVTIRQWVSFTHDRVFDEYVMTDIGGFLLFDPGIVKQLEAARDIYRDCPENGENYVNFIFKHNCSLLDRDFG